MIAPARLGLLGGSLDPIHYGHLDAAEAACDTLALDAVTFVPAYDPPHRAALPHASVFHRFAMVTLATAPHPAYRVSDVELARTGPSYTVDTLRHFHHEGWHPWQLFFILGADAFAEIATWKAFPAILDAAHFVVVARPGTSLDSAVAKPPIPTSRVRRQAEPGSGSTETSIILLKAQTRDVSSTRIRQRLLAGTSIVDLVPEAVAAHISRHRLYGAVERLHE